MPTLRIVVPPHHRTGPSRPAPEWELSVRLPYDAEVRLVDDSGRPVVASVNSGDPHRVTVRAAATA